MVIRTRSKAGRVPKAGRGPSNHQQLFRDHIQHRNVHGIFSEAREKFPEVKIKQERIEAGMATSNIPQKDTEEITSRRDS